MTTDDAPILCVRRPAASWIIGLMPMSVDEFLDHCGWSEPLAARAIHSLMRGEAVRDADGDTYVTYSTLHPAAVARQWLALGGGMEPSTA